MEWLEGEGRLALIWDAVVIKDMHLVLNLTLDIKPRQIRTIWDTRLGLLFCAYP